ELILVARTPGTVTLTLEAARESYADARRELSVTVEAIPADFQLENEAMTLARQGCATVSLWPSVGDATLAFRYDAEALTLRTSALAPDANHAAGFELALTANRSGVFPVEITLTADGYLPSTQTLTVTAVDPSVTLRLADTASLPVGEALRLAYSVTPADAAVTVSVTGGLRATIESGAILLEGIDAGRSTVSLSASADGYRSAAASASVLVIPSVDTDAYAAEAQRLLWLTNQERLAAGLPELVHRPELDAPATRRAEEAIQQWSHTRPDGRGCETVDDEFGLVYQNMGENLFAANVEDAELAISELMASAAHRENILRSVFTGIGVGVTRSRDGDTYYCQLFIA
ncbi:MAG: CAP domain-containing protein, partial [Oscillospiraceae bacterium]